MGTFGPPKKVMLGSVECPLEAQLHKKAVMEPNRVELCFIPAELNPEGRIMLEPSQPAEDHIRKRSKDSWIKIELRGRKSI